MKTMVYGKLETVGHIPCEVSGHTYFYIKEEGGRSRRWLCFATRYCPSLIARGALEIPLMMTFRSPVTITHQKMKDLMPKPYWLDHKLVTENVELDSDSDEFHIEH